MEKISIFYSDDILWQYTTRKINNKNKIIVKYGKGNKRTDLHVGQFVVCSSHIYHKLLAGRISYIEYDDLGIANVEIIALSNHPQDHFIRGDIGAVYVNLIAPGTYDLDSKLNEFSYYSDKYFEDMSTPDFIAYVHKKKKDALCSRLESAEICKCARDLDLDKVITVDYSHICRKYVIINTEGKSEYNTIWQIIKCRANFTYDNKFHICSHLRRIGKLYAATHPEINRTSITMNIADYNTKI
jgi:hypothetical protein